jgi:hypothetical protein
MNQPTSPSRVIVPVSDRCNSIAGLLDTIQHECELARQQRLSPGDEALFRAIWQRAHDLLHEVQNHPSAHSPLHCC